MKARSVVVLLAAALVACSETLEFPDWTIPVPGGTRILEYAPVLPEERTEKIERFRDLVIGDQEDEAARFYGANTFTVDDEGNVYVADTGNHRVQMFDPDGVFIRSFGRKGPGPAELQAIFSLVVAAGRLIVFDNSNARLSVWSVDGTHIGDYRESGFPVFLRSTANGRILGYEYVFGPNGSQRYVSTKMRRFC